MQLHNLCEIIGDRNVRVDKLVAFMKKSLVKNKEKQRLFLEVTNLSLPVWPIVTRWGTWLNFVGWLFSNFSVIKKFIETLATEYQTTNEIEIFNMLKEDEFEREIREVVKLCFLSVEISKLESERLTTEEQSNIISAILSSLADMPFYTSRFEQILSRNSDLQFFRNFNLLESTETDKIYGFFPLTTVEVERSFSKYRDILTDKRKNLLIENLEKYLIIYFNSD